MYHPIFLRILKFIVVMTHGYVKYCNTFFFINRCNASIIIYIRDFIYLWKKKEYIRSVISLKILKVNI